MAPSSLDRSKVFFSKEIEVRVVLSALIEKSKDRSKVSFSKEIEVRAILSALI